MTESRCSVVPSETKLAHRPGDHFWLRRRRTRNTTYGIAPTPSHHGRTVRKNVMAGGEVRNFSDNRVGVERCCRVALWTRLAQDFGGGCCHRHTSYGWCGWGAAGLIRLGRSRSVDLDSYMVQVL